MTDTNGNYLFDNLPGGTYTVEVVSFLPADATITPVTSLTAIVSDGDDVDTIDIAVTGASAIGDQVFVDPNANGLQETGVAGQTDETVGVPGVTVELVLDGTVVATDVTDADGNYDFGNLLADTYVVRVADPTLPTGATDTTGDVTVVLPAASTTDDAADIGVAGNASIGDTVFVDVDQNGNAVRCTRSRRVRRDADPAWTPTATEIAQDDLGSPAAPTASTT